MNEIASHHLSTRPHVRGAGRRAALAALGTAALTQSATSDHLLLSEIKVAPDQAEFIEIVNPTQQSIALDAYFLSDDQDYALLPAFFGGVTPVPQIGKSDLLVRFPEGAIIGPDEVVVVALRGNGFFSSFGFRADFEVHPTDAQTPDMVPAGSGGGPTLLDAGECMILFHWDGASDLVSDVDLIRWGSPSSVNNLANKTGLAVDGPDADESASTYLRDALTIPTPGSFPAAALSLKRIALEGANETSVGGNGITGHDETSENVFATWDFGNYTAPNPGVANLDGPPIADLAVEITGPSAGAAGAVVEFTLTVNNVGTLPAENVIVTAELPAAMQFESQACDPPGWAFEQNGGTLQWSSTTLNYGDGCVIALETTLAAESSGTQHINVAVTTTSNEEDTDNNAAMFIIEIEGDSPCLGDLVSSTTFAPPPDGAVDGADLAYLLGAWGPALGSSADIVSSATFSPPPDGSVDGADLAVVLGAWGVCP
jgi:uncharacterized repeat protein (TIGR01451 family)